MENWIFTSRDDLLSKINEIIGPLWNADPTAANTADHLLSAVSESRPGQSFYLIPEKHMTLSSIRDQADDLADDAFIFFGRRAGLGTYCGYVSRMTAGEYKSNPYK